MPDRRFWQRSPPIHPPTGYFPDSTGANPPPLSALFEPSAHALASEGQLARRQRGSGRRGLIPREGALGALGSGRLLCRGHRRGHRPLRQSLRLTRTPTRKVAHYALSEL